MERVVVTGMGVISPIGNDVETFWNHLVTGKSGIRKIDTFNTELYKTKIAGLVRNFDAAKLIGKKDARRLDPFCHYALAAAAQAWNDARLDSGMVKPDRMGVYVGSGIGGIQTLLSNAEKLRERGPRRVSPLLVPTMIANMAAAEISIKWQALGPSMSPVTACAIGNTSIGEAYKLIQDGETDVMFAGGTEAAVTELSLAGFENATALSARNDHPEEASRPFDAGRDGFVMADGAGIIILESLTHALNRKASIHAEMIGYGASSDAYNMVAPDPEGKGAYLAMKKAIDDAEVSVDTIDVISAHATSTKPGDLSETAAIKHLFGKKAYDIPITANKSMTGHMLGATGGVEAIALIKSLQENIIPPTINQEKTDPACDLDYTANVARKKELKIGLSNSFGFGGHNAVLVLKKYSS
ncbi:beta-ketoacyl-[acyl-carrier-protein] synthase II [Sporolactobacillus shoreae]|uniref:3-oxoacyl-[acyl-carrier-protein] synthase 2 n=1 Tax=Sporolactobacillus shoreae TaxID=1465501 RepID=A0A4Z0GUZ1_9BACL|nr:beta-ketoacyl-ACP synthase II [Sporolactobacillus shoreae]TGB00367.1 beta-ketoacyl-[acyl-carrier-protein] synthase II [Sporolactobacillus shoreae]